ncbi:hypothetical protein CAUPRSCDRAFT_13262 [Caulochytrium protostelioides]|uniref:Uncharacterized protein n=1 Tax=Caulochytrium protostelioides TaxID=1555241 RepID=A0A4P9WU52_9FUNG|nr:hypothetical protein CAUPRSCDRAFT_13262 [Caulochytrium protostelioides]
MPPMAQHGAGAAAARAAARRQGSQASLPSDKAGGLLNALNTPALEQLDEELESPSTAVDASSPQRGAAGGRGAAASDAPRSSIFAFLYRMDVEYIRPYFTVQGPAGPRGMDASSEMLQRMTSQQLFEQGDARPVVDGQGSGSGSMAGGAGSLASPSSAFYGKPSAAATPRGAPAIPEDGEEGAHEGERLMAARGGSATAAVLHFNGGAILGPQRSRQFSIGGASSVGGGSVNVAPGAGFMNTSMSRIPGVGTVSSPGLVLAADDERELAFEAHDEEDEDDVHIGRDLVGRR